MIIFIYKPTNDLTNLQLVAVIAMLSQFMGKQKVQFF